MNTRINNRIPDQMLDLYHLLLAEFGPQYWWPAETEFEVIVGALLTQQTRWGSVELAIANLKERSLLTPAALADADHGTIEECIRCTGFYRQKAERLQLLSQYFDHNGISEILGMPVAELRRELLLLKGVGPETADSIILYAAHKPIFVIDAYTKRICECIGVTGGYETLQKHFEDSLPLDTHLYQEFHALIVAYGKEYCTRKRCNECIIAKV
uniref:Endonuclease III n=1 Tax=Candidatus Methanogaster sp. ANME-2c ERB4 TaxID=2759911 RepID=A0A7G9YN18_9EURY|nr:endonuclease III [Methanosarcinales archaeon ANME-2c ERB4]QNO49402.1 endonuclease III [Methanosarcinales archaeon ANME-2c ERB4]